LYIIKEYAVEFDFCMASKWYKIFMFLFSTITFEAFCQNDTVPLKRRIPEKINPNTMKKYNRSKDSVSGMERKRIPKVDTALRNGGKGNIYPNKPPKDFIK
jgi:hypothetical protein